MVRRLLEERFQLEAHEASRELPVYRLLVAHGGIKMRVYGKPSANKAPLNRPHNPGVATMGGAMTMSRLCESLSALTERPVIDETGLMERYDIVLHYAFPPERRPNAPEVSPDEPDIFVAVQEQLGLKLENAKAAVSVIVVDHVDRKPSEN